MSAPEGLTFTFPIHLQSEANSREHWRAKAARVAKQRALAKMLLRFHSQPLLPCVVTITRIAPRSLDDDNLNASAKSVRDELALWLGLPTKVIGKNKRLHADDSDPRVSWRYGQRKGEPGQYAVEISVTPR